MTLILAKNENLGDVVAFEKSWNPDGLEAVRLSIAKSRIAERQLYLFYCSDKPVGRAVIKTHPEDFELQRIDILQPYQGKGRKSKGNGLGTLFLKAVLNQPEFSEKPMWLEVDEKNIVAQRLYEGSGFVYAGPIKFRLYPMIRYPSLP